VRRVANPLYGLLAVLSAPLACGTCFTVLFVIFIGGTIAQLPLWAQAKAIAWMLGPATGTEFQEDYGYAAATVGVGWDGFSGPGDFPSGVPFEGVPMLGCLFQDPNYINHGGIDFPTSLGDPVQATMTGKVVWAAENGMWGNLVVIENNGVQTYYAHLQLIAVVEGDIVEAGTMLGESGSTGNSTGPHLHYGIKQKTESGQVWLNPIHYFDGAETIKVECK